MPRWNRARITGLKYQNMKKQYEDLVFDFNNGEEAVNTLISLINGGGKGVLLQALFQLMKPGTSWGETENRLYQQFFFNEKEKFQAYTFHIVLEWELDGDEKRYLITGGAFTAERQATKSEDENDYDIKPKFLMYVRESELLDTGLFEFMPLYESGHAVSIDSLEKWLKSHGFMTFERVGKYHELLKSYGIDRKDWETLKEINKNEGGVGAYFEGATDDYSLFRTKIIPLISKRLQQQDSGYDDLVSIFRSQASIAKNLPVLLSRESAFKEFLTEVVPLQQEAQKGVEFEQKLIEHEKSGQRLLAAIRHLIAGLQDSLSDLRQRMEEAKKARKRLDYEKDNLDYAKLAREVSVLSAELIEHEQKLATLTTRRVELDAEHQLVALSIAYRQWEHARGELLQVRQMIERLQNSAESRETKEKMGKVAAEAASEWKELEVYLQEEVNRYTAFIKALDQKLGEHEDKYEAIRNHVSRLNAKKEQLLSDVSNFSNKKQDITSRYGEGVASKIDNLIQLFNERRRNTVDLIDEETLRLANTDEEILVNRQKLVSVDERYKALDSACEELSNRIPPQEEVEQNVLGRVERWLQRPVETKDRLAFERTTHDIAYMLDQHKARLESAKQSYWEKQMAISLRGDEFWIANADIKRLYERLSRQMDVFYGTQFLLTLEVEKREEELRKHPLLPFGLVVLNQEWKKSRIEVELAVEDLQSPVPIFLREEMNESDHHSFVVISGRASELSINPTAYQHYKEEMEEEWKEVVALVTELEASIDDIDGIHRELTLILNRELAIELKRKLETLEENLEELQHERQSCEVKDASLQETKRKCKLEIKRLEQERQRIDTSLQELNAFKEELQKHAVCQEQLASIEAELPQVQYEQQQAREKVEATRKEIVRWKQEYWMWCEDGKRKLGELSIAVPGAAFPEPTNDLADGGMPQLRLDVYQKALTSAAQYVQLKRTQEERNVELARLNLDLEHKEKAVKERINQLEKLDMNWKEVDMLLDPLGVLQAREAHLSITIRDQDRMINERNGKITAISGKLETLNELKDEKERAIRSEHGQAAQEWEGVDLEEKQREITAHRHKVDSLQHDLRQVEKASEDRLTELGKKEASLATQVDAEGVVFGETELKAAEHDAGKATGEWLRLRVSLIEELDSQRKRIGRKIDALRGMIEERPWDAHLKKSLIGSFTNLESKRSSMVLDTLEGMIRFCEKSMADLERDKTQALQAQSFWANRAAMKVMSLSDAIRHMVAKMAVKNDYGTFPLIQLKEDILPRRPEDIEHLLKEHFVSAIDKIIKQFEVIDEHNKKLNDEIKKLVGDEEIMFVALGHRYPTLLVYNMNTENALAYSRPRKEHYATWKTINQGSATTADGSGGQKLAARTVVMMMLLSIKNDTDTHWMTLVCDNPLGQAVSAHVLDPVFEVAKKLKFQLIFVSPPELIKTEVSRRFPVYYKLDFREQRGREIVQQHVQYSFRVYQKTER